jgi:uroporphyrinogen III methyltransferase/synthase
MTKTTGALTGRTVVVTRAAAQARRFVELLEAEGARVVASPTIAIGPPASWEPLDHALGALSRFAWVIFTSVNGVSMVDRRLRARGLTWAELERASVAAIGPATADALADHGVRVAAVPHEYRAEGLVERLRRDIRPGDAVLLARAAQTRDVLVTGLQALGADVTEVPAYATCPVERDRGLRELLASGGVDAVTFTSSSTARNFAELFTSEERRTWLTDVVIASIGPVTAATAAEYALTTVVMPSEYTIAALARALTAYFAGRPPRRAGVRPVGRAAGRRGAGAPPSEASERRRSE